MTDHTPPTDQQLDAIQARVAAALHCPNAEVNGRLDGQHTLTGSFSHIRCELCTYSRPRGERVDETAMLVTEIHRLRAERHRYRIAWRMARTRALSTGGAADRYVTRAHEAQTALQDMLGTLLGAQLERDELQAEVAALRTVLAGREPAVRPAVETGA